MRAGVTMRDPSTVYLDWGGRARRRTSRSSRACILRGRDRRSGRGPIGPDTTIVDSTIGRDCRVWRSVVERSTVEDGATIGPYSHLRPGSHVGAGAEIGNFAEVKNSRLGRGSSSTT